MAKAGCIRVKIGFESGSDRILKLIQKDETTDDMRKGAKMLKDAGVPFTGYFMIGFPEETDDDEDSESADISNKLELLSGKGNGETRNALPPLNTNNRRGSRERRKPSENSNENANAPKIFPMTP